MAQPQRRILLVEDDADIREGIGVIMKAEGYLVTEAASGEQAIALFDGQTDLVILDIMLPGISGFDVLEKLREKSNVPVLFLTARSEEYGKMLGLTIGADDYLTKPFSYVELVARVRALIRRRNVYDRQEANNTVMVHIRRIRKKLEDDPQDPGYLKTVWGRGYRFEARK